MNKIKLPFSNKKAGKTFKIMNQNEMNKSLFSFIKKILSSKENNKSNKKINDNNNKLEFIKGSTTKEYYKKIKTKK